MTTINAGLLLQAGLIHALEADGSASRPTDVPTGGSIDDVATAAFGFDGVGGGGGGGGAEGGGASSLESVLTAIIAPIMQSTDARTTLPTAANSTNSTDLVTGGGGGDASQAVRAQRFDVGAGAIDFHKQRVVRCAYACATLMHEFGRQGLKVPFTLKLKSAGIVGVGGLSANLGAKLGMQPGGGSGVNSSQDGNRMELVLEWDRHAAPLLDSWAGTPPGTRGGKLGSRSTPVE